MSKHEHELAIAHLELICAKLKLDQQVQPTAVNIFYIDKQIASLKSSIAKLKGEEK